MASKLIHWATATSDYATGQKRFDFGLLFLRVVIGLMMMLGHGWGKLSNFSSYAEQFSDPLGLGSTLSLILAIFAEFFCSIAIIFGLLTRLSVIPLIITMLTAAFIVHIDDPWGKQEFAILYLVHFLVIFTMGAGKYSLDHAMLGGREK